jgi:hypothetical protein
MVCNTHYYWVSDFVHRPEFYKQENKTFRKLNLFPSNEFITIAQTNLMRTKSKPIVFKLLEKQVDDQ